MKKLLVVVMLAVGAGSAYPQGMVILQNRYPSLLVAPIYGPEPDNIYLSKTGNTTAGFPAGTQVYNGPLLAGAVFFAQLYAANGPGQPEANLLPAQPTTTFRTGIAAGFLFPRTATLSGVPKDAPWATVQLRVWDNRSGLYPTWAEAEPAWTEGLIPAGKSSLFNVDSIGGDFMPPAHLFGLRSFNIYYIPEPAPILLACAGVAVLQWRRLARVIPPRHWFRNPLSRAP